VFTKSKRGIVGLGIIVFFALFALFASVITPYNQLGQDPQNLGRGVASSMAAPAWLRTLPAGLGGQPALSENFFVVNDSSFTNPDWRWPNGEWNVSVSPEAGITGSMANVSIDVRRDPTGGYPLANSSSIVLTFKRSGPPIRGNVSIRVYKELDYPYLGPPGTGRVEGNVRVDGTTYLEFAKVYNRTSFGYDWINISKYAVAGKLRFFVDGIGGYQSLWPVLSNQTVRPAMFNASGFFVVSDGWAIASPLIETYFAFPSKGRYVFGFEVLLYDYYNATENVETEVRVDNVELTLQGNSWGLLGTDYYGRDIFAQLAYGSRVSLYVGLLSAALSVGIGLLVGLGAGYLGKAADEVMMRVSDILIVLPGLPLLVVLFFVLGASIENLIILNGFLGWMGFAKVVRSQVLSIRERPYIEAAKAAGAGSRHIIIRHVLPNVMGLVYVTLATTVPGAIVSEAALSFLGFADPNRMSWGRMLAEMESNNAVTKLWWVLPPGICIALVCVSFILLGYALDEVLNPKLRLRR
jgi:peptide/nickel transport system permease protein